MKEYDIIPVYEDYLNRHNLKRILFKIESLKETVKFILGLRDEDNFKDKFPDNTECLKVLYSFCAQISYLEDIKATIFDYTRYSQSLHFDAKNGFKLPYVANLPNIEYMPDNNQYEYINKQCTYKDVSILQILKILWQLHKISKFTYAETKRRIKNGKAPQNNVLCLINAYYSSLKGITRKNTISALKRYYDKRYRETITIHNIRYSVVMKNSYTLDKKIRAGDYITQFRAVYEFNTRLMASNSILVPQ